VRAPDWGANNKPAPIPAMKPAKKLVMPIPVQRVLSAMALSSRWSSLRFINSGMVSPFDFFSFQLSGIAATAASTRKYSVQAVSADAKY
jgi:hypothetical protein